MKRLQQWRLIVARLAHELVLTLLGVVEQPKPDLFPEGHGWNGPSECESCGLSLTYVAEGLDRWRQCDNSSCALYVEDFYDYSADDLDDELVSP